MTTDPMTLLELEALVLFLAHNEPMWRAFEADMGLEADSVPAKLAEAHRAQVEKL